MEANQTALAGKDDKEAAISTPECTITIKNNSTKPMQRVNFESDAFSHYTVKPAEQVEPGEETVFVLQAATVLQGCEGSATYSVTDENGITNQIDFQYADPISSVNVADWRWVFPPDPHPHLTVTFQGKAGDQPWVPNGVEPGGSPVVVEYTLIP